MGRTQSCGQEDIVISIFMSNLLEMISDLNYNLPTFIVSQVYVDACSYHLHFYCKLILAGICGNTLYSCFLYSQMG